MLDISALYCGLESPSTPHRYGRAASSIHPPEHQRMKRARSAAERRPIVVWNLTRTCNLRCAHCYTDSCARRYEGELTTDQCKQVLDDLAAFNVPAVLFSGGEPLVRPDLFELAAHARSLGLHVVLSTNGTLIDAATANRFVEHRFAYIGISLDSADPAVHDRFRGMDGAFERTLRGIGHCKAAGQKVGLRLTLTPATMGDIAGVFDLIEREGIDRACFYHLCPAGRGASVEGPSHDMVRRAVDEIIDHTARLNQAGRRVEILTVDNACDGPYLYLRMKREGHARTQQVREMLEWNGGARYSSGVGIANIDWLGHVHADQFSMHRSFGHVLQRPFGEIWMDRTHPVMDGLKERMGRLTGRCARCALQPMCGGSLRARAEFVTGSPWASDPACYLSDEEIGLAPVADQVV